jgi:hypothetical protein
MVFVQTCRGPSTMEIVQSDFKISELAVQQDADMLIAYSTTEGRHNETVSFTYVLACPYSVRISSVYAK